MSTPPMAPCALKARSEPKSGARLEPGTGNARPKPQAPPLRSQRRREGAGAVAPPGPTGPCPKPPPSPPLPPRPSSKSGPRAPPEGGAGDPDRPAPQRLAMGRPRRQRRRRPQNQSLPRRRPPPAQPHEAASAGSSGACAEPEVLRFQRFQVLDDPPRQLRRRRRSAGHADLFHPRKPAQVKFLKTVHQVGRLVGELLHDFDQA